MRRNVWGLFILGSIFAAVFVLGVQRSELSELAQQLIPEGKGVMITLKDGKTADGIVAEEDDQKIVLKTQKGGISTTRVFQKSDIVKTETMDVTPIFESKLKELKTDPKKSLEEKEYVRAILLMAEFLEKCKGAKSYDEIKNKLNEFVFEYKQIKRGKEKIEGEWLTPVKAAVRKFDLYSRQISEIEKKPEVMSTDKGRETHSKLLEKRREAARLLPKTMQEQVPAMIQRGEFDDAVSETVAFLQFWIEQVFKSEGAAAQVFKQMDFDYILRMQIQVMEAYIKAGKGNEKPANVSIPPDMVFVPGGYFLMGKRDASPEDDNFPMHLVYVSPFLIDKYEVSNRDYSNFVAKIRQTPDPTIEHPKAPPLKKHEAVGWQEQSLSGPDQPVVGVDWFDAYAYAKFVGKRLPTEAEWEKAAAGMEIMKRPYPWGDADPSTCAVNWAEGRTFIAGEMDRQNPPKPPEPQGGCSCGKKKKPGQDLPQPTRIPEKTWNVKEQLPEKAIKAKADEFFEWTQEYFSPYGVVHMAGNAAEWVYDYYSKDYYGRSELFDPQGPDSGEFHVIRGGSYLSKDKKELMTTTRFCPGKNNIMANGSIKDGKPMVGFRCAKSIDLVKKADEGKMEKIDIEQLLKELRQIQQEKTDDTK